MFSAWNTSKLLFARLLLLSSSNWTNYSMYGTRPNSCLQVYYYYLKVTGTTIVCIEHVQTLACRSIIIVIK